MANSKIKLPRPDPRSDTRGLPGRDQDPARGKYPAGYQEMLGSPMNTRDHPADSGHTATEHYSGDQLNSVYDALGPKTTYQTETAQMGQSVSISESVPRREE